MRWSLICSSTAFILVLAMLVLSPGTLMATVSVTATVPGPQAVVIEDLSCRQQPFDPYEGDAEISFTLSSPAIVSGVIEDISGNTLRELGPYLLDGGQHSIYWDGRLSGRRLVDPSWYTLTLSAADVHTSDRKGLEIAVSYGNPLKIQNLTVAPKRFRPPAQEAVFRSVISRDARVSLQITGENGATVLSEQGLFWPQGLNSYSWGGDDPQGAPVEPGTYTIYLAGMDSGGSMSDISQTVVVSGEKKPILNVVVDFLNTPIDIENNGSYFI